jgi:D-tyrosyl-tRNA(Tyr) deacylase
VVQRVSSARVLVGEDTVGAIDRGLVVLLGIATGDQAADARWMAGKIATLRIFPDEESKMNRSVADIGGEVLVVSQFTLYGDARKGRRPSFVRAAQGPQAELVYEEVVEELARRGLRCATGSFGATMQVALVNDGPVTLLLDSDRAF